MVLPRLRPSHSLLLGASVQNPSVGQLWQLVPRVEQHIPDRSARHVLQAELFFDPGDPDPAEPVLLHQLEHLLLLLVSQFPRPVERTHDKYCR